VPSSVERKKAVLMYFFVGIVVALSKEKISYYELFHLKQAMGWRTTFFICMVFGIIFIFIPYYLWLIPLILFLCYMVFWVIFVKQAREGRYTVDEDKILLPFFAGIGGWIVSVFEIEVVHEDNEVDES
jgi:uncharacterized membrane protein